jgi:hypothetical protein
VGSGICSTLWRKSSTSYVTQTHTGTLISSNRSNSIPHVVGSLLVYSSIVSISLILSSVVGGTSILGARSKRVETMNLISAAYIFGHSNTSIQGYIGQGAQLSYILALASFTVSRSINRIWNGAHSSLAVTVRMASHSLSTFHSTISTFLISHGLTSSYNDCTYSTLITVAGALSMLTRTNT